MAKKILDGLDVLSKFISPLLMMILGLVFNIQSDVSQQKEAISTFKKYHESQNYLMESAATKISNISSKITGLDADTQSIKDMIKANYNLARQTRDEQLDRSDEIKCINELRDAIGCDAKILRK